MSENEFLSNSLVSKTENYHYWYTPKCACTTTKNVLWALESEAGNCAPINDPPYVHGQQSAPHSPWLSVRSDIAEKWNEPERYTFTFVRNPYSRALSGYASTAENSLSHRYFRSLGWDKKEVPSLIEFLELASSADQSNLDYHFKPLSDLIPLEDVKFDRIGYVENYENDIAEIAERAFARPVQVKFSEKMYHTGAGQRPVDASVVKLVKKIYARDFETFKYSFDPEIRAPRLT